MAVKIGSARGDERGKITGGKAGDQTGKEVSTQNWYLHSKGWRVFRPIDSTAGPKMASCMLAACNNKHIGYDQNERLSLYNEAKKYNFDVSKVTKDVETDCSALTRVCAAYAGLTVSNYNTANEASMLLKSGHFVEMTNSKYTKKSDYLKAGDILVTKTKGHTVIVLNDGPKAEPGAPAAPKVYKLGDRTLKNGMTGADVKELQTLLIALGYSCGDYGIDGDFGDATEIAVRKFQKDHELDVDGEAGPKTIAALYEEQGDDKPASTVTIVGGNCYVRTLPNKSGKALGVAKKGITYTYAGDTSEDGWLLINYENSTGWVSGKYGRIA